VSGAATPAGRRPAPLEGVVVVEAATLGAAPLAGTFLAEFGARVIKVEAPGTGDETRKWGKKRNGIGLAWKNLNRNKHSITIDLRRSEGQELLRALAARADVLIQNQRPSTLERWGLDYTTLHQLLPQLVVLHITAFGRGGPSSDRRGFGTLGEAMSGFAHMTGEPGQPPTLPPFPLADGVAALAAAYGVMVAIHHRDQRRGGGQYVDVNLIDPIARLCDGNAFEYDQLGFGPPRFGNRWTLSVPRNVYATRDGRWLALSGSATTPALAALAAVGRKDWAEDPRFASSEFRASHADEIDAAVAEWVAARDQADAYELLQEAGAAVAPIYDYEQLRHDEHLRQRGSFVSVEDPTLGTATVQGPVPHLSETPGAVHTLGATEPGADTRAVLAELLGFDDTTIDDLAAHGVI